MISTKKKSGGWMDGWVGGWMGESKSNQRVWWVGEWKD